MIHSMQMVNIQGWEIAIHKKSMGIPNAPLLVYVHGGVSPVEATIDLEVDGIRASNYFATCYGYDVVYFNLPGHGDTQNQCPETYTVYDVAGVLEELIRMVANKNQPLFIMGWCRASVAINEVLQRSSDLQVRGIMFIEPSPSPGMDYVAPVRPMYRNVNINDVITDWNDQAAWARCEPNRTARKLLLDCCLSFQTDPALKAQEIFTTGWWGWDMAFTDYRKINVPGITFFSPSWWPKFNHFIKNLGVGHQHQFVCIPESTHYLLVEQNRFTVFEETHKFVQQRLGGRGGTRTHETNISGPLLSRQFR